MQVLVLHFQFVQELQKKLLKTTRNTKKKQNKILMLPRSKLNSIESKVSQELINNEISHEDFMIIMKRKNTDD